MKQMALYLLHIRLDSHVCLYFTEVKITFKISFSEFRDYIEHYRLKGYEIVHSYLLYRYLFQSHIFDFLEGINIFRQI